jgi:hypothetical protein
MTIPGIGGLTASSSKPLFSSRHSAGEPPAFGGIDDLDITLTGRSKGEVTASCKGTAKQAPGLMLDATLVRMGDN